MIRTTMAHKSGRKPSVMSQNIPSHPGSRNVIRTTVSKKAVQKDGFRHTAKRCAHFPGGPGTELLD